MLNCRPGFRVGRRTAYTLLGLAVGTVILVGLIVYYVGVAGSVQCQGDNAGDGAGGTSSSEGLESQGGGKKKVSVNLNLFISAYMHVYHQQRCNN